MNVQNLYKEEIFVSEELRVKLKQYFLRHLVLYNYTLDVLTKNPNIKFKGLKKIVSAYIKEKNIEDYIPNCLYSEIYYLYKKYTNNIMIYKSLLRIQYLTFYVKSYNNKFFNLVDNKIRFKNTDGYILLNKELPVLNKNELFYFNISYSNNEDKFQLSIYK